MSVIADNTPVELRKRAKAQPPFSSKQYIACSQHIWWFICSQYASLFFSLMLGLILSTRKNAMLQNFLTLWCKLCCSNHMLVSFHYNFVSFYLLRSMRLSHFLPPARSDLHLYWLGADMVFSETYNIQKTAITTQRGVRDLSGFATGKDWTVRKGALRVESRTWFRNQFYFFFFCLFYVFGDRANRLASRFVMGVIFSRSRLGIRRGRLEIVLQSTLGREHGIVCRRSRQTDRQGGDGVV